MEDIKNVFKLNYDKLKNVIMVSTCCNNTFMIEYYYKNMHTLIGVEYFTFNEYNAENIMKSIIVKYNNYVSSKVKLRDNIIKY